MTSSLPVGTIYNVNTFIGGRSMNTAKVLDELEQLRGSLQAGDQFPSRRELMQRLGASERAVTRALDEMSRQGKIVKRLGRGGSIVADVRGQGLEGHGNSQVASNGNALAPAQADDRTVMAIGEPDGGVFDNAMQVLLKQAKSADLEVTCRLLQSGESGGFVAPPAAYGPRGYIVFRRHFLPLAERLQAEGNRVVFVGTPYTDDPIQVPVVFGDQEQGGYLAVKHMLDLGHRRIAFHFQEDYAHLRRWIGCQHALKEAHADGIQVRTDQIDFSHIKYQRAGLEWSKDLDYVREYFARPQAPTAIVSWNDDTAINMLTLLQRAGLRVPEDISLIGYDNLARCATVHPALTTVDGVLEQQIQMALRMLTQPIPPPKNQSIVVLPLLVHRESTSSPRAA
jgi:hypothetical protein